MTLKSIVRIILLLFVAGSVSYLVINEFVPSRHGAVKKSGEQVEANTEAPRREVIVYYFHGTRRCVTCRTIEAYIAESLSANFPRDLASGKLTWSPVNIDEPWNNHFVEEFGLAASTAVIVNMWDKEAVKWEKLDRVWKLIGDKPAFMEYMQQEVAAYLTGGNEDE